jgi:hypothetical protein
VTIWRSRERQKADDLARLLLALDRLAGEARPWRPRRVIHATLGAIR